MALGNNNISISLVKQTLGENSYSLSTLCKSSKVNKWSKNSPYDVSASISCKLRFENKAPYSLGDFRGYNHNAKEPKPTHVPSSVDHNPNHSRSTFNLGLELGELDWKAIAGGKDISEIRVKLFNATTGELIDTYDNSYSHFIANQELNPLICEIPCKPLSSAITSTTQCYVQCYLVGSNNYDLIEIPYKVPVKVNVISNKAFINIVYGINSDDILESGCMITFNNPSNVNNQVRTGDRPGYHISPFHLQTMNGRYTGGAKAYAKLNNESKIHYLSSFNFTSSNGWELSGNLPFRVNNGDKVTVMIVADNPPKGPRGL